MLLLVLLMMNADESSKESLQSLLRFYRDNKDLLVSLLNAQRDGAAPDPVETNAAPSAQKEDRPREEVGQTSVIEEYLKRFSG